MLRFFLFLKALQITVFIKTGFYLGSLHKNIQHITIQIEDASGYEDINCG